jgi:hypothetical protein
MQETTKVQDSYGFWILLIALQIQASPGAIKMLSDAIPERSGTKDIHDEVPMDDEGERVTSPSTKASH